MARKGLIDFDEVRKLADFAAILAHYGVAVPGGGRKQIKVLCPLPGHEETKPSCSINLAGKVFHCFGCGEQGNVIDFVIAMGTCDGPVAASREIATICGFDLPLKAGNGSEGPARGHRKPQDARKGPETTNGSAGSGDGSTGPPGGSQKPVAVNQPLTFELKLDPEHPYRLTRGAWLTPEVVQEFGLGFCSRGMMKGRFCIPIHDQHGDLVAYAGRWVGADDELPEGEGKYMLPNRERFDRSLELFNLHRATLLGGDHVLVVEGFFGALRVHVALGRPVVATMGNSIGEAQIALLKRRFERATLLYDGGENGRGAADRAALRMCRAGLFTAIGDLPDGAQPDTVDLAVIQALSPDG